MRHLLIASVAILTMASVSQAAPATQPACDVYVTPFTALGGDNSLEWAGKAVSQNLLTDLAQGKFHPLEADKAPPTTADAQSAAKAAGAKFLITGTYQTLQLQVRFTGQILSVANGNVVGGLSATGSPRDLFALEDSLSTQAIAQLTPALNPQATARPAVAKNKPAPPAAPAAVIVQVVQPPAPVAPANTGTYQGSALQGYVDSNRTPSNDYPQQAPENYYDTSASYTYGDAGYGYYGSALPGFGYGGYGSGYAGNYAGGYGFGLIYSISSGGSRSGQGFGDHNQHGQNHDHGQQH